MINRFRRSFHNLFALVIGIDTYKNTDNHNLSNLKGAVADADAMVDFLRRGLQVPDRNVRVLRNERATRKEIINAIASLGSREDIPKNSPILIYYAGHGATSKHTAYALPNTSTPLRSPNFEVLVPSDIDVGSKQVPDSGAQVTGIADYEIRHRLNQVAKQKGNNIVGSWQGINSF